jgi:hypothetical protein
MSQGKYLKRSWTCSGCRKSVADDQDMLVEIDSNVIHVDHVTAIGLKLRTRFYGPYCNRACWELDAQPGDEFNDHGRFRFDEPEPEPVEFERLLDEVHPSEWQ